MGAKLGGGSGGPIGDINVTPLIDVVLVLLVVFMVITPMLQSGRQVDLPEATQAITVNDVGQYIVVSVTPDKIWWVENEEVDETSIHLAVNREFENKVKKLKDSSITRKLLIKGDRSLEYRDVREVMDVLADAGWTSVTVATSKEK